MHHNEELVLGADGKWKADGEEITHERTIAALFRNLKKDENGYYIEIGAGKGGPPPKRIKVEDTAYFIQGLEGDPHSGYEVILTDGTKVGLDPATLRYRPGRLTCRLMTVCGHEEARFLRNPYFEILRHLQEDGSSHFLDFGGSKIVLARK